MSQNHTGMVNPPVPAGSLPRSGAPSSVSRAVSRAQLSERVERVAVHVAISALYFVAARFGLHLAVVNASATAIWAPTGIAVAAVLAFGYRVWPSIFIAAFLANVVTAGALVPSLGIALGNTLEALAGAALLERFARGRYAVRRAYDILKLAILAGMVATAISATIGVVTITLAGQARWPDFKSIWFTWWIGDAVGALLVAPALLLWSESTRLQWSARQFFEAVLLLASLSLMALLVFGGLLPGPMANYPLEFLCTPFLLWAAYRFGQREAATASVLLAWIALWGTLHGFGPFVRPDPNESLILLQTYMGVSAVMSLVLGAVVSEREQAVELLRQLAVTDPLTGLANYRQFMDTLEAEIRRSDRTGRDFALLLFDLDKLKRINDRHGHVTGSRALCRLAAALRKSKRAIDTAARFGGDEFALILPEADEEAALHVAVRIAHELESDGEVPEVTCSVGVAVYPRDGATCEALLASADVGLYAQKSALPAEAAAR
jgi:diguanylate cyclase (GGDEF)-like protein